MHKLISILFPFLVFLGQPSEVILQGHTSYVAAVAISPDAQTVATGSWDFDVRLWNAASGDSLQTFEGHHGDVLAVDFSPDGRLLASGGLDFRVFVWDIETGTVRHELDAHRYPVRAVRFSDEGEYLLTASDDRTVIVWSGTDIIQQFTGHGSAVIDAYFVGDNILSLERRGTMLLWSIDTGAIIQRFEAQRPIRTIAPAPDGAFVAFGQVNGTVSQWALDSAEVLNAFPVSTGSINTLAWFPDGEHILLSDSFHHLSIWNINTGELVQMLDGHTGDIFDTAISAGGRLVASASADETARLWQIDLPSQ